MVIAYMTSDEQDHSTAFVSHLPHAAAFALANAVQAKEDRSIIFDLASGGFRSTVRLAKSASSMWHPIFQQNRSYVVEALDVYIRHLVEFRDCLKEEDDDKMYAFKDETISPQFHMRTFVDNKKFMRINSSGKVYDCYIGEPNGTVEENTMDVTHKEKNPYCESCVGLIGYTKILYQWDKFDFGTILPTRDRFRSDLDYEIFNELMEYLDYIDDDDGLAKYRAYRVNF